MFHAQAPHDPQDLQASQAPPATPTQSAPTSLLSSCFSCALGHVSDRVPILRRQVRYPAQAATGAPEEAGLGVHLTLDLGGQARFGPDTEWVDGVDYTVDPSRADGFYAAIRRYWPDLREGSLHPAYAGIRPKLGGPDAPAADFRIDGPGTHAVPGLVNLLGIESPGLTSSLVIADEILARLDA